MLKSRKVVIIMTDSQRYDMVNCYRNTGLKTPCLDKMAEQGIRYDSAYTTQPVCQPARAGIFMGQYPSSVSGWTNCCGIADTAHSVGERLAADGVHTAYIGKWHLDGGDYFGSGKCPKGWDEKYWYDMRRYLEELSPEDRVRSRSSQLMNTEEFPEDFTYAHRCSNRAVDFLKNYNDDDFLLVVSYDEPHDPSICPPKFANMYKDFSFPKSKNVYDTLENKPEHQRVWGARNMDVDMDKLEIKSPFFYGCNSFVDYEIGRVLDAVEEYADDAIVIYTSDHGDMSYSHKLWAKGPAAYEEITHIPFIIKGKGVPQGRVDKNPVSHINIAPTVLELMGKKIPNVLEGKSIVKEIENPEIRVNDYVFIEFGRYEADHDGFGGYQPMRAVFDGRYKLVINLMTSDELYDLETDCDEMINLIESAEHSKIRDRLHDALLNRMNATRDPFRGYYWENREWRADAEKPTWDYTLMTRQRDEDERFDPRQLDYGTGMPITETVRKKG